MSTNPFDDENGTFVVLVNDEDQRLVAWSSADEPPLQAVNDTKVKLLTKRARK